MDQRADRSLEFVLDNRRLIIGFFLLVAVCGVFFVIGFMEGKRQAVLSAPPAPVSEPGPEEPSGEPTQTADSAAKPQQDTSVREQLDWYRTVNKPGEPARGLEKPPEPVKAVVTEPEPAAPPVARPSSGTPGYTVQVGAFRQRREADSAAAKLKAKGYDCAIDAPGSPKALFVLTVGRYSTRADAVATQTRLQRDGFKSFVKTTS